MSSNTVSRRCSGITKADRPCRAWAMRRSDPPRCAACLRRTGAPVGNQNRKTHGFYAQPTSRLQSIGDVVEDLLGKQEQLSAYIDGQLTEGADPEEMIKLLALSAQNASRLGRLMRDQRALSGESADGLLEAVGKLMDEINTQGSLKVTL